MTVSNNLKQVLKERFPEERTDLLAEVMVKAARDGTISYNEVEKLEGSTEDLLFLFSQRLLIPIRISEVVPESKSWEDRILYARPNMEERYEMPEIIRYLIKGVEETERWDAECAIKNYLESIEESKVKEILEIFRMVKRKISDDDIPSKIYKIEPEFLKRSLDELELDTEKTVKELVRGGIISFSLRNPAQNRLRFEVNPSLYEFRSMNKR
ncbi:MAG: hypothetical protein MOIL_00987 [Candidatus Methanolliviera sp. GoM_oil]|nr:MAG: hypothetical protein MOIL_00987 [Candidatus Methanolliviera sp. GoM_oil]